ncbi:LamG domain-containing protein [bacterium]|nr:LamG domain-containing protein [bacterium]
MKKRHIVTQLGMTLGALVVSFFLFRCGPGLSILNSSTNDNKTTPAVVTVPPSTISGLRTWLKSDAGVTIATGVSNWGDQSGIGNDFDQATAGSQPGFIASDSLFNGYSSLSFNGSNSLARSVGDSTFGTSEATWAVVYSVDSGVTTGTLFTFGKSGTSTVNNGWRTTTAQQGGPTNQYIELFSLTAGSVLVQTPDTIIYTQNIANIAIGHWSSSTGVLTLYLNGQQATAGGTADMTLGNIYKMTIGDANFGSNPLIGRIAEVILYNRAIVAAELNQLHCYLSVRYNIAVSNASC